MAVELTIYDIIQGPLISDKAYRLNHKQEQLVLRVHPQANKPLIKDAIEKLFNVRVKNIRTLIRKKTKSGSVSRRYNATLSIKKNKVAYVTLAEGYSLNLYEQTATAAQTEEQKKS